MFSTIGYYICIPFAWLTRVFYDITGSYGLALILFTLVVKIVILPFQLKSKKSMLRMNRMQGKIKDIQTRYANNRQKMNEEMSELYAKEGVNPMSGCLWSFIPFPILIALYYIIRMPLRYFMNISNEVIAEIGEYAATLGYAAAEGGQQAAYEQIYLAKFIHENWASFEGKFDHLLNLDYNFIGIDLANTCSNVIKNLKGAGWGGWGLILLPVLAAATQLLMSVITMKQQNTASNGTSKAMIYMMPLMTLWFGYMLPAALCVYWVANAAFSCVQEVILNNYYSKRLDEEETEKEKEKREKRYAKMQAARANYDNRLANMKGDEKKSAPKKAEKKPVEQKQAGTNENGRVGQRPYARGRSFQEDHYND